MNLIINADDFGINKTVTHAILATMDLNLCHDTTMLANFEDSAYAADLAIRKGIKQQIGVHLNLTEGRPLTDGIRSEQRFCNTDGFFQYKKQKRIINLSTSEKNAVFTELTAQIKRARSFGLPVSHADSHNHVHEEPGLLPIVMEIMKSENIPFLRLTNNLEQTFIIKRWYRRFCNSVINSNKLAATDYFGSTADYLSKSSSLKNSSYIEIMIHPGEIKNNQIFDVYSKENLTSTLPTIISNHHLISYSQLNKL